LIGISTRLDLAAGATLGAFGDKLRKQREQRGIALDAISNTTKISVRMLRALEEEHFDRLPGGVFNKGFVRAYARHVGLDEEEAIADYLAALRESQVQEQAIMPDFRAPGRKADASAIASTPTSKRADGGLSHRTASVGHDVTRDHEVQPAGRQSKRGNDDRRSDENHSPSLDSGLPKVESSPAEKSQIGWGKLVLGLVVVTALLGAWNIVRHRRQAESRPQAAWKQSAAAPAGESAQPQTTTESAKNSQGQPATPPAAHTAPTKAGAASSLVTSSSGAGVAKSSETAAAAASSRANAPVGVSTGNNSGTPPAGAASGAAAKPPASFTLLIRAEETTWIAVTVGGKTVAQETLIAPAHTSVRASGEIVVRAGNAAGIRFEMNGKEIPTEGSEAEVKTYVFDANGLRSEPIEPSPKQ
jgi:cytoskeletal protein RodZ